MAGTVLLIEDEHSIGTLVRSYLLRDGFQVVWVRSGEEGLTELDRHPTRLVILDVGLPGMDGFEVCRRIRARSSVPIIMLTARDEEADRVAGLEVGADVSLTVDARDSVLAVGDPDRIVQVVSNLTENALRCTPAGGSVTLVVAEGVVSVQDTGPGLAPEDIPRAFERFYLHRRYGGERPVGTGLGLAIVKELAEAMGGSVSVQSEPGAGATFTVRLLRDEFGDYTERVGGPELSRPGT
jgi:CheY-like chemotaxis protein